MSDITIDTFPSNVSEITYTLRGTRTNKVSSVTIDGSAATLEPGRWRYTVTLSPGENTSTILAYEASTLLQREEVTITVPTFRQELTTSWNVLDEWGQLLDCARLFGERNRSYFRRLINASLYPAGNSSPELLHTISRNFGIQFTPNAFVVGHRRRSTNEFVGTDPIFEIKSSLVRFSVSEMLYTHQGYIDNADLLLPLPSTFWVHDPDTIVVQDRHGDVVPKNDYVFRLNPNYEQEIYFYDRSKYAREYVTVTYRYEVRIHRLNLTVAELATLIEGVLDASGLSYFTVSYSVPGTSSAAKISNYPEWNFQQFDPDRVALIDTNLSATWSDLAIFEAIDEDFRRSWYQDNHAYNTLVERWAVQTDKMTRSGWDDLILDQGGWENALAPAVLPHLWDNVTAYWKVGNVEYDVKQFHVRGGRNHNHVRMDRIGIQNEHWQSGVGATNDLKLVDFKPILES